MQKECRRTREGAREGNQGVVGDERLEIGALWKRDFPETFPWKRDFEQENFKFRMVELYSKPGNVCRLKKSER